MTQQFFLVDELSKILRLHPRTIRRLAINGDIPAFKVGHQWRFDVNKIEQWKQNKKGDVS